MKKEIVEKVGRTFNKVVFKTKKHSPEILVVAGVVGAVTSAVMACKATLKVNDILDETKEGIEKIHEVSDHPESYPDATYTDDDKRKDLTIVYAHTAVGLAKLYGPAIILGTVSIATILTSNNILRKRNAALAAAYAAVDKGFKDYRSRVIERFGERVDYELKNNIRAAVIEETILGENGEEHTEKRSVDVIDPNTYSEYAKYFDEKSSCWNDDPDYNLMFLKAQQNYANDLLKARGYIFLNDVYDMLGLPRTKAGQIVGWVYNPENPIGDNFVDFGIYDVYKEKSRDFVNGYKDTILLDFNVDGNVLDLM